MYDNDLWPPAQPPRPAFNVGETYLLPLRVEDAGIDDEVASQSNSTGPAARPAPAKDPGIDDEVASPRPWKDLRGEIRARIAEASPDRVAVEVSFGLTGYVEGFGGKFCFYSTEYGDCNLFLDNGGGKVEFSFPVEFLSQVMQETLPSYPTTDDEDADQYETPRDSYHGIFTAEALGLTNDGAPPATFSFTAGHIELTPSDGNLGGAPSLNLTIEQGTFFRLYVGRDDTPAADASAFEDAPGQIAMAVVAAAPCTEDQIPSDHLLINLQPIVFTDENGANPTDQVAPVMITAARDTWEKACIVVNDLTIHSIENPNLRSSGNIDDIKVVFTSYDPLTVDVFFVDHNINNGGGKTLDGNTNLAKVFISDNATNPLLLAHEMCHVFRGDHPALIQGVQPQQGRWFGDSSTVASATNSLNSTNPPRNSRNNCIHANTWLLGRNPALQTLHENCCMKPDP